MAVSTPTLLATIADGSVGVTSYESPSFTPVNGDLLLVAMNVDYDTGTFHVQPTITTSLSNIGSWTFVEQDNGQVFGNYLLWAYAKVTGAPGTGTLTFDFGATNVRDNIIVKVYSVTGYNTTTPVAAAKAGAFDDTTNNTIITATFAGTPATDSLVMVLTSGFGSLTWTPRAGYTELDDLTSFNATYNFLITSEISYLNGSATTTVSAQASGNTELIILGIEVQAASVGQPTTKRFGGVPFSPTKLGGWW